MDEPLHPAQIAAYRRMSAAQKVEQSLALYWSARKLKVDALRREHPEWTDQQIEARTREIFLLAIT